jgi:7-cyano-7-deazaguanine synthase in queuosine biosynthesis
MKILITISLIFVLLFIALLASRIDDVKEGIHEEYKQEYRDTELECIQKMNLLKEKIIETRPLES